MICLLTAQSNLKSRQKANRLTEIMELGTNLLLVEDDPFFAENIKQSLQKAGITVLGAAKNLKEAVKIIQQNFVDIALIDIELDGPEDGITTALELLKINWIPIVYMTGHTPLELRESIKKTHPAAFFEKPLRMNELVVQIEIALHNFYAGNLPSPQQNQLEYLFLPADKGHIGVKIKEILYIEASGNYSKLFLSKEYFGEIYPQKVYDFIFVSSPMGNVLRELPFYFYKLSRSVVINLHQLSKIETTRVFLKSEEVQIPEGKHKALMERLAVVKS